MFGIEEASRNLLVYIIIYSSVSKDCEITFNEDIVATHEGIHIRLCLMSPACAV